jgi:hypothetical protein
MLRKLLLVTVAVASLSAVTLAPTPASAWHGGWRGGGWGWGGGWRPGWGGWGPGWRVGWGPGWGPGWGWRRPGWGWGGPTYVVALDFMAEAVSFAVLSRARGDHAGCWSIVAGSRRRLLQGYLQSVQID